MCPFFRHCLEKCWTSYKFLVKLLRRMYAGYLRVVSSMSLSCWDQNLPMSSLSTPHLQVQKHTVKGSTTAHFTSFWVSAKHENNMIFHAIFVVFYAHCLKLSNLIHAFSYSFTRIKNKDSPKWKFSFLKLHIQTLKFLNVKIYHE